MSCHQRHPKNGQVISSPGRFKRIPPWLNAILYRHGHELILKVAVPWEVDDGLGNMSIANSESKVKVSRIFARTKSLLCTIISKSKQVSCAPNSNGVHSLCFPKRILEEWPKPGR